MDPGFGDSKKHFIYWPVLDSRIHGGAQESEPAPDYEIIKAQAQHIFDNIWLGPLLVASNKEYLAKLKIELVVSCVGGN